VTHFYKLRPITLVMIGLGAGLAFYLGKDAGFLSPRQRDAGTKESSDVRQARDLRQ